MSDVNVRISVRGLYEGEGDGRLFEGDVPAEVLRECLSADVSGIQYPQLKVVAGPIVFIDADTHDWSELPSSEALEAWVNALKHQSNCWWITHGRGLRLVFTGDNCEDRALAAALELPSAFRIEIKKDSFHPAGDHPKRPGAKAGPVHWGEEVVRDAVSWAGVGHLTDVERDELLKAHDYREGARYDHTRCPIAGDEPSEAGNCVVVLDDIIYCHRCAAKGKRQSDDLRPGIFPITFLDDRSVTTTIFSRLASGFVHWEHAKCELQAAYPNLNSDLLRDVYRRVLTATHEVGDPRIDAVFNSSLQILATRGGWLEATSLEKFKVTGGTANLLPACQSAVRGPDGRWEVNVDTALKERAVNGFALAGYTPVRPVKGVVIRKDPGFITIQRQPEHEPPVELLAEADMLADEDVEQILHEGFPGVDLNVLRGIIAARFCAQKTSTPVILHLTGPTGAGKGATTLLAGRILGASCHALRLGASGEEWARQIGTGLQAGDGLFLIDEISRQPRLERKVRRLLEVSSSHSFRRLYRSSDVIVPFDAALVLTSLTVPEVFAYSPEICRRVWVTRLPKKVTDWRDSAGRGGIDTWRGRDELHARAANTLLTQSYKLAEKHGFCFDNVAEELGFFRPDASGNFVDEQALFDLYAHVQNEHGERRMHASGRFKKGQWVDGSSPTAQEILNRIEPLPEGGTRDRKDACSRLRHNLEALSWNDVLGIEEPYIIFEIRDYGLQLAFRFREDGKLRGQGRYNEELPDPRPPVQDSESDEEDLNSEEPEDASDPSNDGT